MLTILIVDDEEIIRRGIHNKIDRLVEDVRIVGEAADGEEALLMIEKYQPELIITDIKMPKLDGLQFIEKALECSPKTKFIIVSGYQDFDYAKRAVRLGVSDYLLKPVNNEELKIAVQRLREGIIKNKEYQAYVDKLISQVKENKHFKEVDILSKILIRKSTNSIDMSNYNIGKQDFQYFCAVAFVILNIGDFFSQNTYSDLVESEFLPNLLEETIEIPCECKALGLIDQNISFAAIINHNISYSVLKNAIIKYIDQIKDMVGIELLAGIGTNYDRLPDLFQSYCESKIALQQKAVFDDRSVITYTEYLSIKDNQYTLADENKRALVSYLKSADVDNTTSVIKMIYNDIKHSKVSYANIYETSLELVFMIIGLLKTDESYETTEINEVNIQNYFQNCITLNDFRNVVLETGNKICYYIDTGMSDTGREIISSIVERINNEYYKDIKLQDLANEYYLNKSYLSQLFLKEVGENFKQYIYSIRMQNAKRLLVSTQFSVAKIAELVGYNDSGYFSNLFKKGTGVTPAKYRLQDIGH